MKEQQIKAISLFFFYCIPDEMQASTYINKCMNAFNSKAQETLGSDHWYLVVGLSYKYWLQYRKKIEKFKLSEKQKKTWESQVELADSILVNENIDLSPWKEFQISSNSDELLFVVWAKILDIEDKSIAKGLGISIGTVRYRTSKGLKELGKRLIPGSTGYNFRREPDA